MSNTGQPEKDPPLSENKLFVFGFIQDVPKPYFEFAENLSKPAMYFRNDDLWKRFKQAHGLGDTIDEGMNTIQLAGTDWNDAVRAYNTRRSQIPGEVVARVSDYFGFELPVAFPYYQGANPGAPVQNPLATTPTP